MFVQTFVKFRLSRQAGIVGGLVHTQAGLYIWFASTYVRLYEGMVSMYVYVYLYM